MTYMCENVSEEFKKVFPLLNTSVRRDIFSASSVSRGANECTGVLVVSAKRGSQLVKLGVAVKKDPPSSCRLISEHMLTELGFEVAEYMQRKLEVYMDALAEISVELPKLKAELKKQGKWDAMVKLDPSLAKNISQVKGDEAFVLYQALGGKGYGLLKHPFRE